LLVLSVALIIRNAFVCWKLNSNINMSGTIRTFIAFELPPAVISLLREVQQKLKRLKLRARWVRPENIHLTLKFLGDIQPGDVDRIGVAMADAAGEFGPFSLAVKGLGVFPGIKRPRVIWVGIGGDAQGLFALQNRLAENLVPLGFSVEKRAFKAHLTLGRIKHAAKPEIIRQMIDEFTDLNSEDFILKQLILYKSDLKPSGAVYSRLKQARLGMTNVDGFAGGGSNEGTI
jgi:2'-5' RNA ligase